MSKTSPIIINGIRRLSQEEGLKDDEIADIIKMNSPAHWYLTRYYSQVIFREVFL